MTYGYGAVQEAYLSGARDALAAPVQVDEAKLTGMILGRTAPAAARAIAEWLRGGGQ